MSSSSVSRETFSSSPDAPIVSGSSDSYGITARYGSAIASSFGRCLGTAGYGAGHTAVKHGGTVPGRSIIEQLHVESRPAAWYVRGRGERERLRFSDVRVCCLLAAAGLVVFAVLYVLVFSNPPPLDGSFGDWRTTTYGSAVDDPGSFLLILLDAVTFAGLLFIVASGFSLIFGLMRVVNMAHGRSTSSGYIAYEVQQRMTGQGGFAIAGVDVSTWEWVLPVIVAAAIVAAVGLSRRCWLLLSWNQGPGSSPGAAS